MNNDYLYRAKKQILDPQILSVVAARRAKLLARGARPMIKTNDQEFLDIALLEIAEGLLSYEVPTPEELAAEKARIAAEMAENEAAEENPNAAVAEDVVEIADDEAVDFEADFDIDEMVDFENMEAFPEIADLVDSEDIN